MKRFLTWMAVWAGLLLGGTAWAEDRSVYPFIPKAQIDTPHPEGNAYMRINHMNLLKHDRDSTVLLGDREVKYSLKECVACHAVNGPSGEAVSTKSEKHFCRACHDFAAVKIDCFQCHNSKPDAQTEAMLSRPEPDTGKLAAYLDKVNK